MIWGTEETNTVLQSNAALEPEWKYNSSIFSHPLDFCFQAKPSQLIYVPTFSVFWIVVHMQYQTADRVYCTREKW